MSNGITLTRGRVISVIITAWMVKYRTVLMDEGDWRVAHEIFTSTGLAVDGQHVMITTVNKQLGYGCSYYT
jgi:hypothetical protein